MKPHATVELRKPPPLMARPRLATLGGGSCSSQASTPLSVIALAVSYDVGATGKMDGRRELAGCVSCELACVCVSLERVVVICLASTHTALVSSPSLTVCSSPSYIHTYTLCL